MFFLFHLKSSFRSRDVQIFVFPSSPLSPLSVIYDIINCLNNILITHFLWYLEMEKRHETEPLSIDGVLNKQHLYEKFMQKMCTKS